MSDNEVKITTKEKLIASAVELFSENWYDSVSVAEICRNGGLSNGVFYRYYKTKEELIRQILDDFLDLIESRFRNISGDTVYSRLVSFFGYVLNSNSEDLPYIAIFREGEFRFPEYEQRLRDIYLDALYRVYNRTVSISEYLYIIGSIRFILRRPCFNSELVTAESFSNLVYEGIFNREKDDIDFSCLDVDPEQIVENFDEADTRTKLILSGRQLISEYGFYKVNIFEITRNAGFSVGTFYIHFESKEELFSEIIKYLGKQLRYFISSNLDKKLGRLEQELQGWAIFLNYFRTHKQNYELVREAEFVVRNTAEEYYDRIEKGYSFDKTITEDSALMKNFLMGISHFLGIEVLFGGNVKCSNGLLKEIAVPLCNGVKE